VAFDAREVRVSAIYHRWGRCSIEDAVGRRFIDDNTVLNSQNIACSLHQKKCLGLAPIVASAAACTTSAASKVLYEQMRVKPESEYSPQLCLHLRNTTQDETKRIKMNTLKGDMRV
jgi:hypothetical protein